MKIPLSRPAALRVSDIINMYNIFLIYIIFIIVDVNNMVSIGIDHL